MEVPTNGYKSDRIIKKKKIEQTVGTHKFMQCICLGGIGFLLGMILLPDDMQVVNDLINNKEEL